MSINLWDSMRVFIAVVDTGGFSAAARRLRLQQSVVSRSIGGLESALGTQLLRRTTRKMSLTSAGLQYAKECKRLLIELDSLHAELRKAQDLPEGRLRVNLPLAFGRACVVPLLGEFQKRFPEVVLELRLEDRMVDLASEPTDLVIRVSEGELETSDTEVTSRKIATVHRGIYASKDLLRKFGPLDAPADLARFPVVLFDEVVEQDLRWTLTRNRQRQTVPIRSAVAVNHLDSARQLATMGLGVAVLPTFLAQPSGPGTTKEAKLVRVLSEWEVIGNLRSVASVHALFYGGTRAPAKVRVFIDFLVERLSQIRT